MSRDLNVAVLVQQMRDSTHFEDMPPDVAALMLQGADEIERLGRALSDGRAAGRGHIYCDNCGAIRPLLFGPMDGDDVSGKFTDAADLLCAECRLVIATVYNPSGAK